MAGIVKGAFGRELKKVMRAGSLRAFCATLLENVKTMRWKCGLALIRDNPVYAIPVLIATLPAMAVICAMWAYIWIMVEESMGKR
jgi:hypothetical protein